MLFSHSHKSNKDTSSHNLGTVFIVYMILNDLTEEYEWYEGYINDITTRGSHIHLCSICQ